MRLDRLIGEGFRNLAPFDLDTGGSLVVIHGDNAQGKTNLLEAAWYLATLRPLRASRPRELIGWTVERAALSGWLATPGGVRQHRIELDAAGRTTWLDGDRVTDVQQYFQAIRAVAFVPSDGEIVTEGPVFRRRWLDRAAFTARPSHLEVVRAHARCLAQKAALLRDGARDLALLDVLDHQLATAGARLADRREAMLAELAPHVQATSASLAADGEVRLVYRTDAQGPDVATRARRLAEALRKARADELRRRRCLVGPQSDDVDILIGGRSARAYGSRGQVRSLVLALKLAELLAARARHELPLFLLDDLSSELDRGRTARLVRLVGELGVQVIVTTTDPSHLGALPDGEARTIVVRGGVPTAAGP